MRDRRLLDSAALGELLLGQPGSLTKLDESGAFSALAFLGHVKSMTFYLPQVNMKERELLPVDVLSPPCMGDQRKKPSKGERRVMTPEWKQDVLDKLAANKKDKRQPRTLSGLAGMIDGADKRGIYETFKPGQLTSTYVDAICEVLEIDPPQIAAPASADDKLRALDLGKQDALLAFANGLTEAIRDLPPERAQPIRALITKFLRDFFSDR